MNEPQTPEEWQEAVDAAQGFLALEYTRLLGFLKPGGETNISRCADILARGAARGVEPTEHAIRDLLGDLPVDDADRERIYRVITKALELSGNPNLSVLVPFLTHPAAPT